MVPTRVPEGTGLENRSGFRFNFARRSLLQALVFKSKAIVREAIVWSITASAPSLPRMKSA